VVIVKHPNDRGWYDREAWFAFVAARWWDIRMCVNQIRILKWFVKSFDAARGLADALKSEQPETVYVCVREVSEGR